MREDVWRWAVASPYTLWVAAYPRSGITMMRQLLLSCFGLQSETLYNERYLGKSGIPLVNVTPDDDTGRDELAQRQGVLPVKTHHQVPDDGGHLAIVVVRDGRTTLQSLHDFYAEMCFRTERMEDLIAGDHPWGDWSAWIWSWHKKSNTLWIRYEDMRANLRATVGQIGEWLKREPSAYEMLSFAEMASVHPFFFRRGNRTNDWGAAEEELFWSRHGETMELLGYEKE